MKFNVLFFGLLCRSVHLTNLVISLMSVDLGNSRILTKKMSQFYQNIFNSKAAQNRVLESSAMKIGTLGRDCRLPCYVFFSLYVDIEIQIKVQMQIS